MGQYLTGSITFAKDELGKKACTYHVRYILPETTKNSSSSSKASSHSENNLKEVKDTTGNNAVASASNNTNGEPSTSSSSTVTTSKEKESKDRSKMKIDDFNEALLDFKISTLEKLGK